MSDVTQEACVKSSSPESVYGNLLCLIALDNVTG